MDNVFYNLGYGLAWALPVALVLFCINKIRKNRAEIKILEKELERNKRK